MIKYRARVEIYSSDRGGRPCVPTGSGFSPHACSLDGNEYLPIVIHDVPSAASLNEEFEASIEFLYPDKLDYSVLTSRQCFDLIEGIKRIGIARIYS